MLSKLERSRPLRLSLSAIAVGVAVLSCTEPNEPAEPAPVPVVENVTPFEAVQGAPGATITVSGDGFVAESEVRWNGMPLPTRYIDAHRLEATIGANELSQAGWFSIFVFNPKPGGGLSEALDFVVWSNKPPEVVRLSPPTGTAGPPQQLLQVFGNNFDYYSVVSFGGQPRSTQFVSTSELRVELGPLDLADPGYKAVQVKNPSGLTSNVVQYFLASPVPRVTSIETTQNSSAGQSVRLRVFGENFLRSSVIHLNGSPFTTIIVTHTELQATVPASSLANPGSYEITVTNPPSPGGVSNSVTIEITNDPLTISGLHSYGATAGGGRYVLSVYGAGFSPLTVVRWNGAEKPTVYRSANRLDADIAAADIAAVGTAAVTAARIGASTGTSNPKEVVVRALGAASVTSIQTLEIPSNSVVYDRFSDRFYASVPDSAPAHAGSVVAIDPRTGVVLGAQKLGNPRLMALSPEGGVLWVDLADSARIRRIEIPSLTPTTAAHLGSGTRAEEIKVRPGQPNAIAVEKMGVNTSASTTVMFVDGTLLPASPHPFHANATFAFNETGSLLYGYNNQSSEFGFHTLEVRSDGLHEVSSAYGLIEGYSVRLDYAGGRVYTTNGVVIDAERNVRLGTLSLPVPAFEPAVYADSELGRIFWLHGPVIRVFDMNTLNELGSISLPITVHLELPFVDLVRLVRWGTDGFAFRDGRRIFILRSPLAGP